MEALRIPEISTPEPSLSPSIEKSLSNIIHNEGFIKQKTFKRAISTNGGNYLGELFEVDVKGNTEEGTKETNLFIKRIIIAEKLSFFSTSEVHLREITVYKEILPLFAEFEEEANIPEEERFKTIKFYDANSEAIIFDNVAKKGFKTMDRKKMVSLDYAEKAFTQIAKFHALSFVLEKKRPNYFEKSIKSLQHFFEDETKVSEFLQNVLELSCSLLEGEIKEKLIAAKTRIMRKFFDTIKSSRRVLCHGDYRINNILHREINGKVTELIPIDYQIIYYGNPVNDLMYFIMPSSDQDLRRNHLINLRNLYFNELATYLDKFDLNVENFYPRNEFEKEFAEAYEYGLMCSINMLPFLFPKEDHIPDINQDISKMTFSVEVDEAKDRIQGIVEDFIRWGHL